MEGAWHDMGDAHFPFLPLDIALEPDTFDGYAVSGRWRIGIFWRPAVIIYVYACIFSSAFSLFFYSFLLYFIIFFGLIGVLEWYLALIRQILLFSPFII